MKNLFSSLLLAATFTFTICAQGANATDNLQEGKMQISVTSNGKTAVFELNDSQAARELYAQLPLSVNLENYSNNEKIFYPPKKLNTSGAPMASGKIGTLAYYAPWGDVVLFYGSFSGGLPELGHVISGVDHIKDMIGAAQIEAVKRNNNEKES